MYNMQSTHEICLELVAQVMLVLVFARSYHSIARAVRYNVDTSEPFKRRLDHATYGFTGTNIAQDAQAVLMDVSHVVNAALEHTSDRSYEIAS